MTAIFMVTTRHCHRLGRLVDKGELHLLAHIVGDILQIIPVAVRRYDLAHTGPVGGQHLFLQAADGQHPTGQGYLAGHGHAAFGRPVRQKRHQGRDHGHACRRAVLGDGAGGDMDVNNLVVKGILGNAEIAIVGLDVGKRRPGRLLHHIPQRAGQDQLRLARHSW